MEAVAHRNVVALTPAELIPAQRSLAEWCREKVCALGRDLSEQRQNLRQAKTMKWKHSGWANAVTKTKKRMVYYAKIQAALKAGYLIVPNFDVEVIAVRVQRESPNEAVDVTQATAEVLPQNRGRYVDDSLSGYDEDRVVKYGDGTTKTVSDFHPTRYDTEIDFPASLVKPVVMAATERAMAHRIFDRIGIVRKTRRSDPIVVGQIIDPATTQKWALRSNPKCVTFFIAWWLDTRDL